MQFDVIVVGAGPAGALSAAMLAERGRSVLLVEKSKWPREKVCGGCVNAAGVKILHESGFGDVLRDAPKLSRFELRCGKRTLELQLPGGAAIGRQELDGRLVEQAKKRGVEFMPGTKVELLKKTNDACRELRIAEKTVRARIVLACDGIGGTLLENERWAAWHVSRRSYFGVSGRIPLSPPTTRVVREGTIHMHLGRHGYVGLVRELGVHVAAALDAQSARDAGGPIRLMKTILRDRDVDLGEMKVSGTLLLTRQRQPAGDGVLCVGDACGYVEPFTGEGIAWALAGARDVVEIVLRRHAMEHAWLHHMREKTAARQRWCRMLRQIIRFPRGVEIGLHALSMAPAARGLLDRLARHIGSSGGILSREFA